MELNEIRQSLMAKIKTLNETLWERRATEPVIESWLENFSGTTADRAKEQLHALFLLSNFMYIGSRQIRELLKALYRDLYRYPIVSAIRRANKDTLDSSLIDTAYRTELLASRFFGVGNPSESGCHLLYYFRQENGLPKDLFMHSHQIFLRSGSGTRVLRDPHITRYVFIDDFCGSGKQGTAYSKDIVEDIKSLAPKAMVAYYVLFATTDGISKVKTQTKFDDAQAIFELDPSFKCFSADSRFFRSTLADIDKSFCMQMCRAYGNTLVPTPHALGYDDSELLIGFHHNTPDNTLPIIWYDEPDMTAWRPIFRRYPKLEW